jgi:hypothetical protein
MKNRSVTIAASSDLVFSCKFQDYASPRDTSVRAAALSNECSGSPDTFAKSECRTRRWHPGCQRQRRIYCCGKDTAMDREKSVRTLAQPPIPWNGQIDSAPCAEPVGVICRQLSVNKVWSGGACVNFCPADRGQRWQTCHAVNARFHAASEKSVVPRLRGVIVNF